MELRIEDGGTGLVPQWRLAHASFAASWFQPLATMAAAREISEIQFLNFLNESEILPSIKMLKTALGRIGYNDDLIQTYEAYQQAIRDEISRQCAQLPPDLSDFERAFAIQRIIEKVNSSFKFQKFFCQGILKKHAKVFRERLSNSALPFAANDITRFEDRQDKFARRVFTTQLWDHRTKVS